MRDAVGNLDSLLVLGGGSDIANETVTRLASRRLRRVVLAVRDPSKVTELVARHEAEGLSVEVVTFDGADPASHEKAIDSIFAGGDIDVAISAFGQLGNQDRFDDDPVAAANLVTVNLAGQISALTATAAAMKRQGHGTIVVLSSVAGERVRKDNAVYGATKAGLDGFAQGLGDRLAGTGVDVMIVRPGFVHTSMTEGLDPAPFPTTPDKVAADIVSGLDSGARIVWSPPMLRWVFTVLRHLPHPLWRLASNR
ncbi:MAG: SDR family NAD(P)-dependent oxidoreductase [Microthrixaceae bacterium]